MGVNLAELPLIFRNYTFFPVANIILAYSFQTDGFLQVLSGLPRELGGITAYI
jgi:hypothetical protein